MYLKRTVSKASKEFTKIKKKILVNTNIKLLELSMPGIPMNCFAT